MQVYRERPAASIEVGGLRLMHYSVRTETPALTPVYSKIRPLFDKEPLSDMILEHHASGKKWFFHSVLLDAFAQGADCKQALKDLIASTPVNADIVARFLSLFYEAETPVFSWLFTIGILHLFSKLPQLVVPRLEVELCHIGSFYISARQLLEYLKMIRHLLPAYSFASVKLTETIVQVIDESILQRERQEAARKKREESTPKADGNPGQSTSIWLDPGQSTSTWRLSVSDWAETRSKPATTRAAPSSAKADTLWLHENIYEKPDYLTTAAIAQVAESPIPWKVFSGEEACKDLDETFAAWLSAYIDYASATSQTSTNRPNTSFAPPSRLVNKAVVVQRLVISDSPSPSLPLPWCNGVHLGMSVYGAVGLDFCFAKTADDSAAWLQQQSAILSQATSLTLNAYRLPPPNTTIVASDSGCKFFVHDWVLYASWQFFRIMFDSAPASEEMKTRVISLEDIGHEALQLVLRVIYGTPLDNGLYEQERLSLLVGAICHNPKLCERYYLPKTDMLRYVKS